MDQTKEKLFFFIKTQRTELQEASSFTGPDKEADIKSKCFYLVQSKGFFIAPTQIFFPSFFPPLQSPQ